MEIVWSEQALGDVEEIGDYIAKDFPQRAVDFIDELLESVSKLENYPESGSIVTENPIFRQVVHEGYRIIYQFRNEKVSIVTILGPGQMYR